MKKLLCLALAITMILTAVFVMPASAASDTLTITANGTTVGTVKVGSEFLFTVGLYAGEKKILNGQAHLDYDTVHLSFVPFTAGYYDEDNIFVSSIDAYSFPAKILSANLVINADRTGQINYNFTKSDGVAVINNANKYFARFRFVATAAGTADITNTIAYMIDVDEQQIYYKEQASTTVNPYQRYSIETPVGLVGDVNSDQKITIMDATIIQRAAAGIATEYSSLAAADINGDRTVSLRDAMYIKQYLANLYTGANVGSGVYTSES
jgi:hypothetical protein